MKLGDLLTLLREGILNDRSDATDASTSDYLWTDDTLVMYMNEAQNRMAAEGLILRDGSTDEVTKVTLVAGQDTYPLHEAIVAVISAKIDGQFSDLRRVGHATLNVQQMPSDGWDDPSMFTGIQPGTTIAYSTDEELSDFDTDSRQQVVMRVFPVPSADQAGSVVRLRVARMPLELLVTEQTGQVPEIPDNYHVRMLDWAAYLALRIVDDDAGAPARAQEFATTFENWIVKVRKEAIRKLYVPIGWGFGRGGWSWGH